MLTNAELETLRTEAEEMNARIEKAIQDGQLMALPLAGQLFGIERQNFTKPMRLGLLKNIQFGRMRLVTREWVQEWRDTLAFTRKTGTTPDGEDAFQG